jgi:hypothetical protein
VVVVVVVVVVVQTGDNDSLIALPLLLWLLLFLLLLWDGAPVEMAGAACGILVAGPGATIVVTVTDTSSSGVELIGDDDSVAATLMILVLDPDFLLSRIFDSVTIAAAAAAAGVRATLGFFSRCCSLVGKRNPLGEIMTIICRPGQREKWEFVVVRPGTGAAFRTNQDWRLRNRACRTPGKDKLPDLPVVLPWSFVSRPLASGPGIGAGPLGRVLG